MGALIAILLLSAATLISEDLTCITAGQLAARGEISLAVAIVGCFVGIYFGDLGLWLLGRLAGRRILRWRRAQRIISDDRAQKLGAWFDRNSAAAIFSARFMPGLRLPLYTAAGALGRSGARFAIWTFIAAAVWTPLIVCVVEAFGDVLAAPLQSYFGGGWIALLLAIVLCWLMLRLITALSSPLARARAAARLARWRRWEFWPMWLFYPPVIGWILWLSLRHRGLATIAAANPGIPHGGFVGESKFQILRSLESAHVARTALIPAGTIQHRATLLDRTLAEWRIDFPIILKPDVGQRGAGVRLIRNRSEAIEYLSRSAVDLLLQPYHPGPYEAGIFYYRMPRQAHGSILSITDKLFPRLIGDGRSTVEALILKHPRYRLQADTFLRRHAEKRSYVPAAGEQLVLAIAGNHCQGTTFCDGAHLITPALVDAIDRIARSFSGFYFGRFDVRYSDVARFMAGEDLTIIELNGVTSESTNIYDPSWSIWRAYRQLFRQWSILFQIGSANRARGRESGGWTQLLAAWRRDCQSIKPLATSD